MGFHSLEGANQPIRLSPTFGLKSISDNTLPIHTRVRPRASSSWQRTILLLSSFALLSLLVYRTPLSPRLHFIRPPTVTSNPAYLIVAENGAVATENERCSDIGVDVLKDGGNAVDAAISAALCVGVVNMFSAGIGGGGFMTVRIPPKESGGSSEVYTVDFRETAPAAANSTMYGDNPDDAIYGGLAVAVPGEIRGWEAAYNTWGGNLSWSRLFQPSIDLAAGWTVDVELAKMMQIYSDLLLNNPDWSPIFAPNGTLLVEGDPIYRTNYSNTLQKIADEGPDAFYKGDIADSIIRKINETGGILTNADLEGYTVKVRPALQGTYHDKKVYTTHAPTSGSVLLFMLNLLERYDLAGEGRTPLNVHRIVEAEKFGFAARSRIGDLDFYTGNISRVLEIPTKEFADSIAPNLTDDRTHSPEYYGPDLEVVKIDHGTSHISVADKDGMAVTVTHTVNWYFGSQVLDTTTGIILNDEMDDFTVPGGESGPGGWPSPYNFIEPGKRPLSSISPTIVEYSNGSLNIVTGASGGSRIFPAVFQTILNELEWGMDASQAVEYGRVQDQLYPEIVYGDNILPAEAIEGLIVRGHIVTLEDPDCTECFPASVQNIVRKDGMLYAASDSRKNGIAAGY